MMKLVLSSMSRRRHIAPSVMCRTASSTPKKKGWLNRMAPPKGGTEPPDAKFLAVAAVVCSAAFYAWFIDPPVRKD
jgi:hypothetical protein